MPLKKTCHQLVRGDGAEQGTRQMDQMDKRVSLYPDGRSKINEPGRGQLHTESWVRQLRFLPLWPWQEPEEGLICLFLLMMVSDRDRNVKAKQLFGWVLWIFNRIVKHVSRCRFLANWNRFEIVQSQSTPYSMNPASRCRLVKLKSWRSLLVLKLKSSRF